LTNIDKNQILLFGSLFLMCYVVFLYFTQKFEFIRSARKWLLLIFSVILIGLFLIADRWTQTVINIDSFLIKEYSIINFALNGSEPFGIRYETAPAKRIDGIDWFYKKAGDRSIRDRGIWINYAFQDPRGKSLGTDISGFIWELKKHNLDLIDVNMNSDKVLWDGVFKEIELKRVDAFPFLDSIIQKVDRNDSPEKIEGLFSLRNSK